MTTVASHGVCRLAWIRPRTGKRPVPAHGEQGTAGLDEGGLQHGDRRQQQREHQQGAAHTRPDLLAELDQNALRAVRHGVRRHEDIDRHGDQREQQERQDHTDDPAEPRSARAAPGLLAQIAGHVPAPERERGDQRARHEGLLPLEVAEAEPGKRELRPAAVGQQRGHREADQQDHLHRRDDGQRAGSDPGSERHHACHQEEPARADERGKDRVTDQARRDEGQRRIAAWAPCWTP